MPRWLRSRFFQIALLIVLLLTAGWVMVDRWQMAREQRAMAALKVKLEKAGGDAAEHHRLGLYIATRENKDEALAHLEIAAEREPDNLRYGNDVRLWCIHFRQYDRSIRFFERLVSEHGDRPEPRLQLALAYVDKMPDHMMGIVGQGKLSNQSIAQLTKVLENEAAIKNDETHWAALYALGMNHLYWPKALRHAPDAVAAFTRCIEFQQRMSASGPRACFVLPYVGLGDALVKNGQHDEARKIWKEARAAFPDDERLKERLALEDDAKLTEFIDKVRGLGIVVDTDLAILWGRTP